MTSYSRQYLLMTNYSYQCLPMTSYSCQYLPTTSYSRQYPLMINYSYQFQPMSSYSHQYQIQFEFLNSMCNHDWTKCNSHYRKCLIKEISIDSSLGNPTYTCERGNPRQSLVCFVFVLIFNQK